jgi:hypothetical protein
LPCSCGYLWADSYMRSICASAHSGLLETLSSARATAAGDSLLAAWNGGTRELCTKPSVRGDSAFNLSLIQCCVYVLSLGMPPSMRDPRIHRALYQQFMPSRFNSDCSAIARTSGPSSGSGNGFVCWFPCQAHTFLGFAIMGPSCVTHCCIPRRLAYH